jgi:hypothetical protein
LLGLREQSKERSSHGAGRPVDSHGAFVCGIAAWAIANQTKENIARSQSSDYLFPRKSGHPAPTQAIPELNATSADPLDLEGHNWKVNIRSSRFPALEGMTDFQADHTFNARGSFLVPLAR